MNILFVNPCRPFHGMQRHFDYMEILKNSLARAFSLNNLARLCIDEAIHLAYSKSETVIMLDIVGEIYNFRKTQKYPEAFCFELEKKFQNMVDPNFSEYSIFCEKDGVPINTLDAGGLRVLMSAVSNGEIREFLGQLILHSLMF